MTTFAYDNDGRLIKEMNAQGKTKTFTYNILGYLTRVKDENDRNTSYSYNYLGNVLAETQVLLGATNKNVTIRYSYDDRGNLLSVTDQNNRVTTYKYNVLNERIEQTLPDKTKSTYVYNKRGNLIEAVDANGTVVTSTYNTLGKVESKNIATGTGVLGTTSEQFNYDALGRISSVTSSGQTTSNVLAGETEPTTVALPIEVALSYDSFGQIVSETQTVGGNATEVKYEYDLSGNRTSVQTGTGYLATYSYDALSRSE